MYTCTHTPVDVFFAYMWNVWDSDRAVEIFGQSVGNIIAYRWRSLVKFCGIAAAVGVLYESLSPDERAKLWHAALKHYSDHGRD